MGGCASFECATVVAGPAGVRFHKIPSRVMALNQPTGTAEQLGRVILFKEVGPRSPPFPFSPLLFS